MTQLLRSDAADTLAAVGRHWGWVLIFGVITVAAGVAVLIWPAPSLLVVAIVFGIQLIVTGVFRFVSAFASADVTGGTRVLWAVLGALSLIIGLYSVRHVLVTIVALALLLGIFWVVNGAIELFAALSHREMPARGWTALMGILSVVAGIVILSYPGISVVALAVVLGIWLLLLGMMEITTAIQIRSLRGRT
jgi:uncharacterized membrane protein HdeD (DUF308 family)